MLWQVQHLLYSMLQNTPGRAAGNEGNDDDEILFTPLKYVLSGEDTDFIEILGKLPDKFFLLTNCL